ncbi:MAG: hypothetical protein J5525_10145 [Lachnospiraceae bacterium]|nr:hypothetical protein [Lachnospiraceae bacterium]
MSEFGFKVTSQSPIASIVKIVRRYKDFSIADIKNKVEKNEYIFTSDVIDKSGNRIMLKCIKELNKANITTQLYESDEAIDLQLLKNWLGSSRQTLIEIEAETELEQEDVDPDAIKEYSYLWTTGQKDWYVIKDEYDYTIMNEKTNQLLLIEDEDLNNQVASMMIMQGNKVIDKNEEDYD